MEEAVDHPAAGALAALRVEGNQYLGTPVLHLWHTDWEFCSEAKFPSELILNREGCRAYLMLTYWI